MDEILELELYNSENYSVDMSIIDVSEADSEVDKAFLQEKGAKILVIEGRAEFAIRKIVGTIQGRASLEKGKVIAEVQDYFKATGTKTLTKWYASVGLEQSKANRYANAYRTIAKFQEMFDGVIEPEKVLECGDLTLEKIHKLPESYKEEALEDIAAGKPPTTKEISELAKKPEVKLSKAQELLAAALKRKEAADAKWEEVKADPEISSKDKEYRDAQRLLTNNNVSVKNFEEQIATLQTQIEEEKLKAVQAEERQAAIQEELDKMKFDDEISIGLMVKRTGYNLQNMVPQVLADVQRFHSAKEKFPEELSDFLEQNIHQLYNYLKQHYDN